MMRILGGVGMGSVSQATLRATEQLQKLHEVDDIVIIAFITIS